MNGAVSANLYLASLVIQDDKSWQEKDNEIHRLDHATPVLTNLTSCQLPMNEDFIGEKVESLGC